MSSAAKYVAPVTLPKVPQDVALDFLRGHQAQT